MARPKKAPAAQPDLSALTAQVLATLNPINDLPVGSAFPKADPSRFAGTREEQVAQALSHDPSLATPLPPLVHPKQLAQVEMAGRILARRRLLPFVRRMNERYDAGWVHEDICARLERFSDDVAAGKSPRLMLLMPPRHGKSELASKNFPAWHLGRYPDHEFIACSYNLSLAMGFSRKVKQLIDDPLYQTVFETRLDKNNQSTEEWAIAGQRGGYVAAGIGGPITGKGAHCLHPDTLVSTSNGNLTLAHLYLLESVPDVTTPLGPRRVLAVTKRPAPAMFELRFASGAVLQATGEHPVYLPDRGRYATVGELHGETQGDGRSGVRVVREALPAAAVRPQQVAGVELHPVLLQPGMQPGASRGEERQALPGLCQPSSPEGKLPRRGVLLPRVPAQPGEAGPKDLPGMQRGVSAAVFQTGLLRGALRQHGPHEAHARGDELEFQNGQRIRVLVRPDEAADLGQGQGLRDLFDSSQAALPPLRRGPQQQRPGEPDHALFVAPQDAPRLDYDTLLVVERAGGRPDFVYDLQVEDAGCFFAEGVLVGNCLVIDDPVKNAEEADSGDGREKIWEWYLSTAYTRLAPGGGVLLIQTWWHDDDLAGRLQQMMASADGDMDIDQFEVVKYPAIAENDEYLDPVTGAIVYEAPPSAAAPLRLKGEALHPNRYPLKALNKIRALNRKSDGADGRWWSALYQQNPVPDDGSYFTKEQFRRGPSPHVSRCNVFIAWDFAISEKKQNDYTVGTVGLQDDNDVLHVVDVMRFRSGDAFFIVESILDLTAKWYSPTLILGFEDGQIYRAINAVLKKRMHERRIYPAVEVLTPITDKMARARAIQGRMQQGMVSFSDRGEWYDPVRAEMLRFPAGVHDDCVDSLAWMAHLVIRRAPPRKPRVQEVKSWKDKLKGLGTMASGHMSA